LTLLTISMVRSSSTSPSPPHIIHAIIDADPYVLPLIHAALSHQLPKNSYKIIASPTQLPTANDHLLQITPYESLDFTHHLSHPKTSLANSYVIRKALIRKHYLHNTITSWWSKHPDDRNLKGHVPLTVAFEVDYAEFLDEALLECWELHESFAKEETEWWVLKPGMSDQGQGIRLFSSEEELKAIFEAWEEEMCSSDHESDTEMPPAINAQDMIGAGTMTSQLRHFIAQRYIQQPLLLPAHGDRKFHIRSYVLAVGALQTYVYRGMLALFAPLPYSAPGCITSNTTSTNTINPIDDRVHLTNTCLQDGSREDSVISFWDLQASSNLSENWKESVFDQICAATGTLFEAAAREQMIHFQTLENSFEVFGIDWMVDDVGNTWLLEVNAFPDFKQSGEGLKDVVAGLWEAVVGIAVRGFFGLVDEDTERGGEEQFGMKKVLDVDLGRR
jgi:tubulin--tyrosine ligase